MPERRVLGGPVPQPGCPLPPREGTHQRGGAHADAVLVEAPGRRVKHHHSARLQGAPQLGARVPRPLCRVQVP